MMLTIRPIDPERDRDTLLELHRMGNYDSETPWARTTSYDDYREKWLSTEQTDSFLTHLSQSMEDERTIASIWEEDGVWVAFREVEGYDVTIAEVNDIAVSVSHRRRGIGTEILEHVEELPAVDRLTVAKITADSPLTRLAVD